MRSAGAMHRFAAAYRPDAAEPVGLPMRRAPWAGARVPVAATGGLRPNWGAARSSPGANSRRGGARRPRALPAQWRRSGLLARAPVLQVRPVRPVRPLPQEPPRPRAPRVRSGPRQLRWRVPREDRLPVLRRSPERQPGRHRRTEVSPQALRASHQRCRHASRRSPSWLERHHQRRTRASSPRPSCPACPRQVVRGASALHAPRDDATGRPGLR